VALQDGWSQHIGVLVEQADHRRGQENRGNMVVNPVRSLQVDGIELRLTALDRRDSYDCFADNSYQLSTIR